MMRACHNTETRNRRFARPAAAALLAMAVLLPGAGAADASRLLPIPCLSGFVTDTGGNPVDDADLDFTDSFTGQRLITPGDNTDASGFYNVCVLPGTYDVSFAPPAGSRLMGKLVPMVPLTSDPGLELDVQLEFGTVVSGLVSGSDGLPVGDVDVDVDRVGGGRIYTPDDNSDLVTGAWRVVVPDDLYRFRFEPPLGSRWRGAEVDSVLVDGDTPLDITLVEGVLLSGQVTAADAGAFFDVDIDLRRSDTGAKVFLANNTTDVDGYYVVAAPTGVFELRIEPPRGSHYVAALVSDYVIAGDQVFDQALEPGLLLTVAVRDEAGRPIAGADIDVKIADTGAKVFTPHDRTDADGLAPAALPAGTYTVQVDPPVGTIFDRVVVEGVTVTADGVVEVVLPEVPRASATGRVLDERGDGLADIVFDPRLRPGGSQVYIPEDATAADGSFDLALPIGDYDVMVVPARGRRLAGVRLDAVPARQDSSWGDIVLEDAFLVDVTVRDALGRAVAGADLDVFEAAGEAVFTPWDTTDEQGVAQLALPPGTYRLVATPPAGADLAAGAVEDVLVAADAAVDIDLTAASGETPGPLTLLPNHPNPFNAGTTVTYALAQAATVSVDVYDVRGRLVRPLESGYREAGAHDVPWDGAAADGRPAPAGAYIVRITTDVGSATRLMALVR